MSHPHKKTVSIPAMVGQNKILFSEPPGKTALLINEGRSKRMKFKDAHAALDWCLDNEVSFYYLRAEYVGQN